MHKVPTAEEWLKLLPLAGACAELHGLLLCLLALRKLGSFKFVGGRLLLEYWYVFELDRTTTIDLAVVPAYRKNSTNACLVV